MSMQRDVVRMAKLKGLTLQSKAVKMMVSLLNEDTKFNCGVEDKDTLSYLLDGVKSYIDANPGTSRIVDDATIQKVIAELSKDEEEMDQNRMQVLNAFDTPKLQYDPARKLFSMVDVDAKGSLHSGPQAKVDMFRDRYLLALQRAMRSEKTAPLFDNNEVETIDTLLGGQRGLKYLTGMLCEVEEGVYHLEDLNASVRLDLTNAHNLPGLLTENQLVLAHGEMHDGVFHVIMITSLFGQTRDEGRKTVGFLDIFKTGISPQQWESMQQLENTAEDALFVIVSDLHLDRPLVLDKLRKMFEGFSDMTPLPLFIFMGDFCSRPISYGRDGVQQLIGHFEKLTNLICEFPKLSEEGYFVFVPGPQDPGAGNTLPRAPLATKFTSYLASKVPNAIFATNPCRVRFYAQEIVIFRDDILKKMQRHCILPPRDDNTERDVTEHLVASVIDQGHLCPLPLISRPIHWKYDHALRLYPLPTMVVLADHTESYKWNYGDCLAINPGSFSSDFSFMVYRPADMGSDGDTGAAEPSRVD